MHEYFDLRSQNHWQARLLHSALDHTVRANPRHDVKANHQPFVDPNIIVGKSRNRTLFHCKFLKRMR